MPNITNPCPIPQVYSLTKRDFSKRHSISERTVDNWLAAGCPCLRVSTRKILLPLPDADDWLRERFLVTRKRPSTLRRRVGVHWPATAVESDVEEGAQ